MILLFSIWLHSQHSAKDKGLRYFWLTVISCLLLVVQDQLEQYTSLNPDLLFWRTLLSVVGYVLRSVACVGLLFVVIRPNRRQRLLWLLPCTINLLVCSTAFFTDLAFSYDSNYKFYRGPLGYIAFIVPIFYLCVIMLQTFRRYVDRRKKTDRLILFLCVIFCLLSALLDSTRGGVRLHEAMIGSSIFFYLFLRTYDIRRDSLTSVLTRQSLYNDCDIMQKDIRAAASLDMNGLKVLNNQKGLEAGDDALKKIGGCLQAAAGTNTRAYRIGGDEFVLLFFSGDEQLVRKTLESIHTAVEKAGLSISSGYALREENEDPESLIRRADLKMFEQKAQYYKERKHDRRKGPRGKAEQIPPDERKALEESPLPLAVYQFRDHRVETLVVSDGFCQLFGYPDHNQAVHVLDQDLYGNVHPDDRERFSGAILRFSGGTEDLDVVYRSKPRKAAEYRVIHARGSRIYTAAGVQLAHVWYMDEGAYVVDEEGSGTMMTQALSRALHEESLLNATHYDELTGLPGMSWFFKLYEARKTQLFSAGKQPVLLYIDLTGMKYFNHQYGFAEGDKLLKAFSGLLVQIFEKENSCHISADRFAAGTDEDGLEDKLRRLFEESAKISSCASLPVRVGIYSAATGDVSVSAAFDRAKMACDSIRHSDSSCFKYYSEEMRDAHRKQQYIVANIDRAIQEKWIRAYYQPIFSAADQTLCDEEALARWIDPKEGFLSPADFIPFLENAGLIYKVDLYILEQVIEKIVCLRDAGKKIVPQSINLSRSDFEACDIFEEVRRRVDDAGVRHDLIHIEITESVIGENFDFMNEQVKRFRENGFAVWMDDFGSGYSSLDVLQSIRFDLIKFDMSFLHKLDEGENGKIILTELMRLASRLNLDTVCEGVEKEEHMRFLQEIGCAKLQGYYFGKPAPWEPEKAEPADAAETTTAP